MKGADVVDDADPHPNPLPQAGEGVDGRFAEAFELPHPGRLPQAGEGEGEIAIDRQNPFEADVTYPLSRLRERVGVRAQAKEKARDLRTRTTETEALLWQQLRGRRFQGFKFRRQRPLGPYILDFVCLEAGLVVEIDGGQHSDQQGYDQMRTALIESQGLAVIRFWNHEVMNETPAVLDAIWHKLQTLTPTLSRKREGE